MDIEQKFSGFKNAERPSLGVALIFDIAGFTNFFNKPDVHLYMTEYISHIVDCMESIIWGGYGYWLDEPFEMDGLPAKPIMRKFLGDGMLYVWEEDDTQIVSGNHFKITLINRLWNLQQFFSNINKRLNKTIPFGDLPKGVKIGIARGTIFKITDNDGDVDCIGPCINLASRLVKYCPELNFMASARLNLSDEGLDEYGYMRTIAIELRSFENEIVVVEKDDFNALNEVDKERLFRFLPT